MEIDISMAGREEEMIIMRMIGMSTGGMIGETTTIGDIGGMIIEEFVYDYEVMTEFTRFVHIANLSTPN